MRRDPLAATLFALPLLGLPLLPAGCASSSGAAGQATARAPLYQRLGGKDAIAAVVRDFLKRVANDDRINARFAKADLPRLERLLVEQICEATGGPCTYTGRDMQASHVGMNITDAEFDALVEDLKAALDYLEVPGTEQGELLGALGGMRDDIVEARRPGARPAAATASNPNDPVTERAHALREAAGLLDKASAARGRGNRSLAEQLFSAAELLVGPEPLAALASAFRDGAPPRVSAPPVAYPKDAPPQPRALGNSDEDEPEAKPARGALAGAIRVEGAGPSEIVSVVTLEPLSGKPRRRAPRHRVIEQRDRQFAPNVLAVPVGSTVSFPNLDGIYHNVFSRSEAKPFDLGIYKSGQTREVLFEKEGLVRVGCNLHANMAALVVVVGAPHYAITDGKGAFAFRSLEPGKYRLRAYSARSQKALEQAIEIKAGKNAVALELKADTPAAPGTDKFGAPRVATR